VSSTLFKKSKRKSSAALTADTAADISQAPLTITSNNDTKVEGSPYVDGAGCHCGTES
jgi:hypothetical protein